MKKDKLDSFYIKKYQDINLFRK